MKRRIMFAACGAVLLAAAAVAAHYGAGLYYAAGHGTNCADCHEMARTVTAIHGSPHHTAGCTDCHEASVATKLRHLRVHTLGPVPEEIRLRDTDVGRMMMRCQACHQHEYASWHAGPHAATFAEIFTSPAHNAKRRLMDDCFRCHGMYFDGGIRDLVQPLNTTGPWRLMRTDLGNEPAIPCQSCHWIHHEGQTQVRPQEHPSLAVPALRDSLAFYDRREELHFGAISLGLPQLFDGARPIHVSPDARQGLCYQCHAPRQPETLSGAAQNHWGAQAGSGDDRTPTGVHEGLSCFACHSGHGEGVRASCAGCHPQMSHCGLDVEKMDTTFANAKSTHNIHWVKCTDCHQHGVPKMKMVAAGRFVRGAAE